MTQLLLAAETSAAASGGLRFEALTTIAALAVVAFAVGRLTRGWLSEVIVFLALGIVVGPEVTGIVDAEAVFALDPVLAVALGAIVFGIGERLELPALRKVRHTLTPIFVGENVLTFAAVFAAMFWLVGLDAGASYLLASIALSTSPTTLVAVIAEKRASGSMTDHALAATALNNVTSALLFGLGLPVVLALQGEGVTVGQVALTFAQIVIASLLIGGAAAWVLRRFISSVRGTGERLLFVLVVLVGVVALSRLLDVPVVISTLAAGALTANDPRDMTPIFRSLKILNEPIFLVFFLVAGANVHLAELVDIGLFGVAYVAARTLGKVGGGWAGTEVTRSGRRSGWQWSIGLGLLPFAGMAIGLAAFTVDRFSVAGLAATGSQISNIVLGSVVVFELLGPLSVGRALDRARESGRGVGHDDDDAEAAARFAPHRIHHILFPVSTVEMARQKAPIVADLALSMGAALTAMHIVPEGVEPDPDVADPALSVVRQQAATREVKFEAVVKASGDVVRAIVDEAARAAVDLIVMGEPQPRLLDRGGHRFVHDVTDAAPPGVRVMVIPTALDRRGQAIGLAPPAPAVAEPEVRARPVPR